MPAEEVLPEPDKEVERTEAPERAEAPQAKPARKPPRPRTTKGQTAEAELGEAEFARRLREAEVASVEADAAARRQENERLQFEFRQLLCLRWVLGLIALVVVGWWQFSILAIVERQGSKLLDIPIPVLLALVTTTTVNVFGFLLIVYRFVFPQPPRPEPRPRKAKPKR